MRFFEEAKRLTTILESAEGPNITAAAQLVAESIMAGGILQAFGGGHSYAAAIEVCGRAGGLIPSKVIPDPAGGLYESVEGVAPLLTHRVDKQADDIFILISNSGRNPMQIELAEWIKESGNKLIVVTALASSKLSSSRHSNGKLLYEYADVILDNHSVFGDAALGVQGFDAKVCGTSSFAAVLLLQQMIYEAVEVMVTKGYEPPIYKSANIDGGPEFNMKIESDYASRIFHM